MFALVIVRYVDVLTVQSGFVGKQPGSNVCPGTKSGKEKEIVGKSKKNRKIIPVKDFLLLVTRPTDFS